MLSSSASRSTAKWQKRCKLNGLIWKLGSTKDLAPLYGEWSSQTTLSASLLDATVEAGWDGRRDWGWIEKAEVRTYSYPGLVLHWGSEGK